jgi:hypothetical protein
MSEKPRVVMTFSFRSALFLRARPCVCMYVSASPRALPRNSPASQRAYPTIRVDRDRQGRQAIVVSSLHAACAA